jgi:hypothetical protein
MHRALEIAHSVAMVAFDKTGTLTEGRPSLVALEAARGYTSDEVLRVCAALQKASEHPRGNPRLAADSLQVSRRTDIAGRRRRPGTCPEIAPGTQGGAGAKRPRIRARLKAWLWPKAWLHPRASCRRRTSGWCRPPGEP